MSDISDLLASLGGSTAMSPAAVPEFKVQPARPANDLMSIIPGSAKSGPGGGPGGGGGESGIMGMLGGLLGGGGAGAGAGAAGAGGAGAAGGGAAAAGGGAALIELLPALIAALSDRRCKENIVATGDTVFGVPVYEWSYTGQTARFRGPMAQDLEVVRPDLVCERGGFKYIPASLVTPCH